MPRHGHNLVFAGELGHEGAPDHPAGTEDGTQMRLGGKGEAGPGGNGDALVTIQVQPHPFFKRDGDNIRLDLPVSLAEAVAGAKVRVPTVDSAVMLTVALFPSRLICTSSTVPVRTDWTRSSRATRSARAGSRTPVVASCSR